MKVDRSKLKKTPTEAVSMHNNRYMIDPGPCDPSTFSWTEAQYS